MDRNQPFIKYNHESQVRVEVPMHSHTNGQLSYVSLGTVRLLTPTSTWVVPRQRLVWIPPDQLHSVRCEKISGSWKIMTPRSYAKFLPKNVAVLQATDLLIAALGALPENGESLRPSKLRPLIEVIKQELSSAEYESFGVTLPRSKGLKELAETLLKNPEDPRQIDEWAYEVGMSRRTFTRSFMAETGSSFGEWRKNLILSRALELLSQGESVSETADQLGYASPSAFIVAFRRKYGTSPLRFIK